MITDLTVLAANTHRDRAPQGRTFFSPPPSRYLTLQSWVSASSYHFLLSRRRYRSNQASPCIVLAPIVSKRAISSASQSLIPRSLHIVSPRHQALPDVTTVVALARTQVRDRHLGTAIALPSNGVAVPAPSDTAIVRATSATTSVTHWALLLLEPLLRRSLVQVVSGSIAPVSDRKTAAR